MYTKAIFERKKKSDSFSPIVDILFGDINVTLHLVLVYLS